jgi:hypothetical protein
MPRRWLGYCMRRGTAPAADERTIYTYTEVSYNTDLIMSFFMEFSAA